MTSHATADSTVQDVTTVTPTSVVAPPSTSRAHYSTSSAPIKSEADAEEGDGNSYSYYLIVPGVILIAVAVAVFLFGRGGKAGRRKGKVQLLSAKMSPGSAPAPAHAQAPRKKKPKGLRKKERMFRIFFGRMARWEGEGEGPTTKRKKGRFKPWRRTTRRAPRRFRYRG